MSRDPGDVVERRLPISFRRLLPDDAGNVFALFERVSKRTEDGFLADRSLQEFRAILAKPSRCAAVGAFAGDMLAAYTLCSLETQPVYRSSRIIRLIQEREEPLWLGKGTVIDPSFEGRMLMSRLLKKRHEFISDHGIAHSAGLIATKNVPSLAGALRAGSWIVGLEMDEYCLNFVCYAGQMQSLASLADPKLVPVEDLGTLTERLAAGWVGTDLKKDVETGRYMITLRCLAGSELLSVR